jgi:hypothetical protein
MALNVGDVVEINGSLKKIKSRHSAGKHVRFEFTDGESALDLDALIEAGTIKFVPDNSKVRKMKPIVILDPPETEGSGTIDVPIFPNDPN